MSVIVTNCAITNTKIDGGTESGVLGFLSPLGFFLLALGST